MALCNHAGCTTALGVFQLLELATMQAGQHLLPCSSQCSCCLNWGLAFMQTHSHLDRAFKRARHCGNSSGCQMPRATAPPRGFLSISGFEMLKLGMTAQQLGAVNWVLLAVTFSKVKA